MSSTDLKPIQPVKPTRATTTTYHVRDFGTTYGSAARSTTPVKDIARRVMLEPICELISQTPSTKAAYTAVVIRTVFQSFGTA